VYVHVWLSFYINSIFIIERSLLELRTPLIRTLVIRIVNYSDRLAPLSKFVENYMELTCLGYIYVSSYRPDDGHVIDRNM